MPKEVVYGPAQTGGLGIVPLFGVQSIQKIKYVLQVYRLHTPLRNIMHTNFQWIQRIIGTSQTFLM